MHSVSSKRQRRADDLVEPLEAVKADAEARGFVTPAYFIETALIEARLQACCAMEDMIPQKITPSGQWPR